MMARQEPGRNAVRRWQRASCNGSRFGPDFRGKRPWARTLRFAVLANGRSRSHARLAETIGQGGWGSPHNYKVRQDSDHKTPLMVGRFEPPLELRGRLGSGGLLDGPDRTGNGVVGST